MPTRDHSAKLSATYGLKLITRLGSRMILHETTTRTFMIDGERKIFTYLDEKTLTIGINCNEPRCEQCSIYRITEAGNPDAEPMILSVGCGQRWQN